MSPDASSREGGADVVASSIDAPLRAWIDGTSVTHALAATLGVARLRLVSKARARAAVPGPEVAEVTEYDLGRHLRARLIRPVIQTRPLVVYLHGGSFVLGDLDTHDRLARRIAVHGDVAVLAVDYRRAPEHRAPAAVEDADTAVRWAGSMLGLLGGDERAGVGLAGDTAGGLLASAAAIRLRDQARVGQAEPATSLLLLTPQLDLTLTSASVTDKGHGWGMERADLEWYVDQWAPSRADRFDPAISPVFAALDELPSTFLVTAEHDPLRDDGLWFGDRLRAGGIAVEHLHFRDLVHDFFALDEQSPVCRDAGDEALRRYGSFLRYRLSLLD